MFVMFYWQIKKIVYNSLQFRTTSPFCQVPLTLLQQLIAITAISQTEITEQKQYKKIRTYKR